MSDLTLLGPTRSERPAFRFRTRLDGAYYVFRLAWNSRYRRWYLDIADIAGNVAVTGLAVVVGHDLLAAVPGTYRPPGQLYVTDDSGAGRLPGLTGWRRGHSPGGPRRCCSSPGSWRARSG